MSWRSRYHPITLAFRDDEIEREYVDVAASRGLTRVRFGLAASIATWLLYLAAVAQVVDFTLEGPAVFPVVAVMVPYLVLVLVATRWLRGWGWQQWLGGSGNLMAFVVANICVHASGLSPYYSLPAHLIVAVFAFFALGLRFPAAAASVALATVYLMVSEARQHTTPLLLFHGFMVVAGVGISGVAAYLLEIATRDAFHRERELARAHAALRATQAQLVQSEKMASLGQLVAGLAHEMNTPLGAIVSNEQTMSKALDKLRAALEALPGAVDARAVQRALAVLDRSGGTMSAATDRVGEVVRRMRSFARLDEASLQDIDVAQCIDDALAVLAHRIPEGVEVTRERGADETKVRCDPAAINQLLLNLLSNAVDAVGDSGRIVIRDGIDDEHAVITIEDDGEGLSAEALERAFDPGYTTKGVGVGAGLGLAIAYQIAKQHRGDVQLESAGPNEGASATVRLALAGALTPPRP